ncbi:twin-arginine translocase subunit TatC [Desulfoluna spongiiphila]|uniref:twin-arginine translocase subunit TatC n=1 Tax=Desulfoluna spongiiphila TaxID=419481 RepID=UPI00125B9E6F|nr:twin-arginine translocase subunit TatC [Desulfoluna spongiiphila]VVS93110.1 sec-independent periplasmic protein translocase tatc [Desulfoluna spongiiphila]
MQEEDKLPFTDHLEELRTRLIRCFIAIAIGAAAAYAFKEVIFNLLTRPLIEVLPEGDAIIFTGLPEAFFTYLKVSLLAGLLLASPVIIFEIWMFIAPGLYKREKWVMGPAVLLSVLFFTGGALFGYYFVFPFGFKFFLGFASESLRALPTMKEYLSFASKLLMAFGLAFELPIFITILAVLGLVTPAFLRKNRKYAVVFFFIFGAILTPPDVVTQILLATPMILLYELSIFGAMAFGRRPLGATDDEDEEKDENQDAESAVKSDGVAPKEDA